MGTYGWPGSNKALNQWIASLPLVRASVMRSDRFSMLTLVASVVAVALFTAGTAAGQSRSPAPAGLPSQGEAPAAGVASDDGGEVASAVLQLERAGRPYSDAYADYMTVGPIGSAVPNTGSGPNRFLRGSLHRRLRVIPSSCERDSWLTIDDMRVGWAGSHWVAAEFRLDPFATDMRPLWVSLVHAPRVSGAVPTGPPIRWLSSTSFEWVRSSDTLAIQQKSDSTFQVTIRVRVR